MHSMWARGRGLGKSRVLSAMSGIPTLNPLDSFGPPNVLKSMMGTREYLRGAAGPSDQKSPNSRCGHEVQVREREAKKRDPGLKRPS